MNPKSRESPEASQAPLPEFGIGKSCPTETPKRNAIMKHPKLVIAFLSAAAFGVGCKPTAEQSTDEDREANGVAVG